MEVVFVELDNGVELDAIEYREVAGAELISGTDLGSGRGKRMECGRDGRRESRWGRHATQVGGAGGVRPASHER